MSNQQRQREILNKRLIASEPEPGCEICGEPTNNAEPICPQCYLERAEYYRDVQQETGLTTHHG